MKYFNFIFNEIGDLVISKVMKGRHLYIFRLLIKLFFICAVAIISNQSFAQTREYLLKAGYIEKFTHFIEWPNTTDINNPNVEFTIAVIGRNEFDNSLEKIFGEVKINKKKVRIKYISSINEIENSLILFISKSERNNIDEILKFTSNKPILTIGDTKGYAENGVIINMFIDKNKLRYEINRTAAEKSGLKISSLLLTSATIVKSDE